MKLSIAVLALSVACAERQIEVDPQARYAALQAEGQRCVRGEFRPLAFPPDALGDVSWTCYLSLQLRRMSEPPLWPAQDGERYRLLALGHYDLPLTARVDLSSGLADGTIMEGGADFRSDKAARRKRHPLSPAERDRVLAAVEAAGFWSPEVPEMGGVFFKKSPTTCTPAPGGQWCATEVDTRYSARDATSWFFEGVRGGKYRVVELRTSRAMKDYPKYAALCRALADAAGLRYRWDFEKAVDAPHAE